MNQRRDILVAGDQCVDPSPFLVHALVKKPTPLLQAFLRDVQLSLRIEIASLPHGTRTQIPAFSSLHELVEEYQRQGTHIAPLDSALTCLAQLTHFIGFCEENPHVYLQVNSLIIGTCTGLLAASAIASSDSLVALIPLAVETVRIAFRLGARAASRAESLEPSQTPWTSLVTGVDSKTVLTAVEEFNQTQGLRSTHCLYVSSVATNSVAVSGPPSIRARLFEMSPPLRMAHHRNLPIYAPYHAPHLFSNEADILDEASLNLLDRYNQIHTVCGFDDFTSRSTSALFAECIHRILQECMDWNPLVMASLEFLAPMNAMSCRILSLGPTPLGNALASALKHEQSAGLRLTLEDHASWLAANPVPAHLTSHSAGCNIAIIGMAGRFPDAANHEAFWDLLAQGLDVHRKVPPDRFDADAHTDPSGNGKNKSHTPYGCFIEEPGKFDPRFFNMSPREAKQTDPMQRLAITTAYEAMESAGFVLNRTPTTDARRVGTFYGQTSDDWREINAAENIDTYFITGGVRAFGPGRMNYHFGFSGPSFSLDTACSSSFAAIQLACTSLCARDCDTVFAGGMNVLTNPDIFAGLSKGQFLSKTGSCKTFDNEADGYCRGDGVVTVILKRVEDAIAENDPILAVIRGTATNHSADAVSITHPHADTQQYLFQKIMDDVGADPREVNYVEMHGTGTQVGDGIEIQSVTNVFAPRGPQQRTRHQPLYIGSAKANIGHGEAVSGVSALVKVILMFQKNLIPPHCGIKGVINQGFPSDLQARGVHIASQLTPFPKGGRRRMAFVNNFSAAGGNSAMLVEDAPERPVVEVNDNSGASVTSSVVTVSAKSLASLANNTKSLLAWIDQNTAIRLADLAYTTTARRVHYTYRAAFAVDSVPHLHQKLQAYIEKDESPRAISQSHPPSVAFVFTGQGAQYVGMGEGLFAGCIPFRSRLQQLDQMSTAQGFPSFLSIIDGSMSSDLATQSPVVTQLASTSLQMALADLWKSWGVVPSVVLGHSLGEYAALYVTGVLSAMDTLFLVGRRAQLLESMCVAQSHGMLAVQGAITATELMHVINDAAVGVACLNSQKETVLAGPVEAMTRARETLTSVRPDLRCIPLKVPFAFHSAQVDPILESLAQAAESIVFHPPRIPILSPVSNSVIDRADIVGPTYFTRHARDPVNFVGSLEIGATQGLISPQTVWLDLGPHPVCSTMVQSVLGSEIVVCASLQRKEKAWKPIAASLSTLYQAGVAINWNEVHAGLVQTQSVQVLRLPTYGFDEKNYWLDYTNNWTLTKGDMVSQMPPPEHKFSTTSIQRIVSKTVRPDGVVEVVAETDLHEPKLNAVISGHQVGGAPLCPSSLNADMAFTIAKYTFELVNANTETTPVPHMNICNMESAAPLILNMQQTSQLLIVKSVYDATHGRCQVSFHSGTIQHAHCEVRFEDGVQWAAEFHRHAFLVHSRIQSLQQRGGDGTSGVHTLYRGMAYKLFTALVDYSPSFQGMDLVSLDSVNLEATARVQFKTKPQDGEFLVSPYHTDSVAHISGFVMNANDAIDSSNQIYISHGWESMRFVRTLEAGRCYRSYVKMSPVSEGSKMVSGDVYVLEDQEIIGVVGGLRFQCVPRKLMLTLLGIKNSSSSSTGPREISMKVDSSPVVRKKQSNNPVHNQTKSSKPALLPPIPPSASIIPRALDIIAVEVGCSLSELDDNIPFVDLGVDSLMSLSITARFREELEVNISTAIFLELTSVGQLKAHLEQFEPQTPPLSEIYTDKESVEDPTQVNTPAESDDEAGVLVVNDDMNPNDHAEVIRSTIAGELGVDIKEVGDTVDLSQMGLDSLMSLAILGALREKTGLTFPSDFLIQHTTVKGMLRALGLQHKKEPTSLSSYPPAPIILLSGNLKTARRKLFLLPDGSGAAFSYAPIPELDAETAVFGLNCPFMRTPEQFTIGVPAVTQIYMQAIKSRQPTGPYLLGGWSAGGVLAYEMTRQLIAQGDKVDRLVLIDSPYPIGLEALPAVFHEFCNRAGLLGDGQTKTPDWLLPHFRATVRELTAYSDYLAQMEIDTSRMPSTTIIWARDGVIKNRGDPEPNWEKGVRMPNSMEWLCNNRQDLGDNGWETLVGKGKVRCVSMEGNHFTMMRESRAAEVGRLVKEALDIN